MKTIIKNFERFDSHIIKKNLKFNHWDVWPILRVPFYQEIVNEVCLLEGKKKITGKRKKNLFIYFRRVLELFTNILSLKSLVSHYDILVINNENKKIKINNKLTSKLIWTFENSLSNDHKLLIVNTQSTSISKHRLPIINCSSIISFVTKIICLSFIKSKWLESENVIKKNLPLYFDINLDYKKLYQNLIYQVVLGNFFKLLIKIRKPKLIIFSDNGGMCTVNKIATELKIPTVDYQHAVNVTFHIVYNHNENISKNYRKYLSDYLIVWGKYKTKKFDRFYKCRVGGNAYLENEAKSLKKIRKEKKSILIISDGSLTRDGLSRLLSYLAKNLKNHKLYFKLRPDEYDDWKLFFSRDLIKQKNIFFISADNKNLYTYLKKCNYVIGTCSSVLVEALPFTNVIIYDEGFSFIMQDYINDKIFLFAKSREDVLRIISSNKKASNDKKLGLIFYNNSLTNINKIINNIVENK